mgnify:CR=1 FL=1
MRAFSLSLAAPVAALVLASPLMTVACGSDSTGTLDAGSTDGGAVDSAAPVDGSVEGNDCITYTPAEIQGTAAGSFARADEVVRVNLPRTDRGGGLLKVTYEATGVPLNGRIFLGAATEFRAETGDFGDGLGGAAKRLGIRGVFGRGRVMLEGADDVGGDPRQQLIMRLLEYQKYKEAADRLDARPIAGRDTFARGGKPKMPTLPRGIALTMRFTDSSPAMEDLANQVRDQLEERLGITRVLRPRRLARARTG